ncbi:MAG: FtsX-like permease family protein [Acidobacteriota bacterium]
MLSNILKLGLKNISRNKKRTFFTILAITLGITMLVFASSYIEGILTNSTDVAVKIRTGHVKIISSEFLRLDRIMPKEELILNSETLSKKIKGIDGVKLVSPFVKFHSLISKGELNEPAVVMGCNPEILNEHMGLAECVLKGSYLSEDKKEAVIGRLFAEKMNLNVNDEILILTTDINYSTYALPFRISGIFDSGFTYIDKHLVFIPVKFGRQMLDCGDSSHEILVYLNNKDNSGEVSAKIGAILGGREFGRSILSIPWQEDEIIGTVLPMAKQIWSKILGIILLIVALVILNTMLMTVMERNQEVGVLKALGMKNREIFSLIVTEALFIGFIGSFLGILLGGGLSAWLQKTGINFAEMVGKEMWEKLDIPIAIYGKIIYPELTMEIIARSFLFGLLISIVAVLYPAVKSSKMLPVEAFRSKLKV